MRRGIWIFSDLSALLRITRHCARAGGCPADALMSSRIASIRAGIIMKTPIIEKQLLLKGGILHSEPERTHKISFTRLRRVTRKGVRTENLPPSYLKITECEGNEPQFLSPRDTTFLVVRTTWTSGCI